MDEVGNFFCQFLNPWALRVSGMGGYTSKCEKSQNHCTLCTGYKDRHGEGTETGTVQPTKTDTERAHRQT